MDKISLPQKISELFGIDENSLFSARTKGIPCQSNISDAKHLLRKVLFEDLPYPRRKQWDVYQVADYCQCKHASVSMSCKVANNLIQCDKAYREKYNEVIRMIENNELFLPERPVLTICQ
jgi:hypothetical protein